MSRFRIVAGLLALVAATFIPALGHASPELWAFQGYVTDVYGDPLEGASVTDQANRIALTDSNGYYRLGQSSSGGQYTLRAMRKDTSVTTRVVNVTIPTDHRVDFTLYYRISGTLSSHYLSTALGEAQQTLTLISRSPRPGLPGEAGKSCVVVTDSRTGQKANATLDSINPDNGASSWTYTLTAPMNSPEGSYDLSYQAVDCLDGRSLNRTAGSLRYMIDNTAPSLIPVIHSKASDPEVRALLDDNGGSGVPGSHIQVTLDGIPLSHTRTPGGVVALAPGTVPGNHDARIVARDNAGNVVDKAFTLTVDGQSPSLSSPSPVGVIASRTPRISAALSDDVGIDPASISLRLSWLAVESKLPASFEPSTGEVSYEVPNTPKGIQAGEAPLVDGDYTVTLIYRDLAGNEATTTWTFRVSTLL